MDLALEDLRPLVGRSGRFLTLLLPAPSHHADAAERFAIQRKTALKAISSDWPADDLRALDDDLATLPHDAGAGLIVVRSSHGDSLTEFIDDPVEAAVFEGRYPRLAPLIESRQRTIAHVVVEADLAGANLTAFDGGDVLATDVVEGETEYIHRGHAGGWSQRRFQQRAENTWEENADDVADAARRLANRVHARLIAVAGPDRARTMVVKSLAEAPMSVVSLHAGDPNGIADEVVRLTADIAAADALAAIQRARESMATTPGFVGDVLDAVTAGRVETLIVHDDGTPGDDRYVDRCIAAALSTGASIRVVPNVSALRDGVGAVLRW